jgi:hypothetical protein
MKDGARRLVAARLWGSFGTLMDWQPIIRAPWERDVELAVIDPDGAICTLTFPCRRTFSGWLNAKSREWVQTRPTHWRDWQS